MDHVREIAYMPLIIIKKRLLERTEKLLASLSFEQGAYGQLHPLEMCLFIDNLLPSNLRLHPTLSFLQSFLR